ncbi:MAG: hypothetical protein H6865_05615 [Rhodospirillales bacterium]|nr:hypothetical protein [Alphaproteobacteria bacterium]MCB9987098.1 hypothetical protein [Rhodospirillales bacterium]USO08142.1 MAG: hypothetical protein H6866_02680 [Rhodospirillales bacterium]
MGDYGDKALDRLFSGFEYILPDGDIDLVWKFFCALNLPVPQRDEYIAGNECLLVFLRRYGMVVRIGSNLDVDTDIDHPHVLRPIAQCKGADIVIELLPALVVEHRLEGSRRTVISILKKSGISVHDPIAENFGYLPDESGFCLVLDRGCVSRFWPIGEEKKKIATLDPGFVKRGLQRIFRFIVGPDDDVSETFASDLDQGIDRQAEYFAPVVAKARALLPDFSQPIGQILQQDNVTGVQEFWAYCEAEVEKSRRGECGVLFNPWGRYRVAPGTVDPPFKIESIPNVAARYMPV